VAFANAQRIVDVEHWVASTGRTTYRRRSGETTS
jgi:hypothetical protein